MKSETRDPAITVGSGGSDAQNSMNDIQEGDGLLQRTSQKAGLPIDISAPERSSGLVPESLPSVWNETLTNICLGQALCGFDPIADRTWRRRPAHLLPTDKVINI